MLRRYFSLVLIVLLLLGCTPHSHQPPSSPIAQSNVQVRPLPAFNQVAVQGMLDVNLHTGYKRSVVILRGDPRDLKHIEVRVKNNSLVVYGGKKAPCCGTPSLEIRTASLNAFTYKGSGTIRADRLRTSLLELSIYNSGQTRLAGAIALRKLVARGGGDIQISGVSSRYLQLEMTGKTKVQLTNGIMNVAKLQLKGSGWLSLYWVKSPLLTVCAKGKTRIQLAGVVDKLDLELWGSARFNGRYLRAKNAFVKTHDRAVARLTAIKHQHTLATDASDIYFYKIPQTKADFMAYQGSVLDMRDLSQADVKDYDRYNKETN